jgi:NADPH-dependent curcumin reductase CurA
MATMNKRFVLASRPTGEPTPQNFRLEDVPLPTLKDGEVLVRHHYLSLDPYMRGRMNEGKSYAQPQALDAVMVGGTVGEVVESRQANYKAGDKVVGYGGWQQYSVVPAGQPGVLRKVDTSRVPISAYLGAVGMPGVTAWVGLSKIIEPKEGETIVVSAASGAVGSAVGQLAKARGCRAVGIAGGADKCNYVVRELGFDACVDYKQLDGAAAIAASLKQQCPNGIDGYFENVGAF